jgi:hypothetical protein
MEKIESKSEVKEEIYMKKEEINDENPLTKIEILNFQKSNLEPKRILDVSMRKENNIEIFSFTMVFINVMNHNQKSQYKVTNLDILTERYKLWILARYKKNLKELEVISEMKNFSKDRLLILENYCKKKNINYEKLLLRSALPPTQVYTSFYKSKNNDSEKSKKSQKKSPRKVSSMKDFNVCCYETKNLPIQPRKKMLVKEQNKILKLLLNKIGYLKQKYSTSNQNFIARCQFFKELDDVNNTLHKINF